MPVNCCCSCNCAPECPCVCPCDCSKCIIAETEPFMGGADQGADE